MAKTDLIPLDLNFQGNPRAIAVYLIKHRGGAILVECGPASTLPTLQAGLQANGLEARDVTHVLLTHIHLDHAGSAGWWARQGAQIYVHPIGAPHLLHPEKLLSSAARIYGDQMQTLWGEFLPVPQDHLHLAEDGSPITVGDRQFLPVNTPGHAEHHHAYLFEDVCFSGDIGAVRIPGFPYLRLPMPPPELDLGKWRASIERLCRMKFARIAPTHFGIFDDPAWHLDQVAKCLDETDRWLEKAMTDDPPVQMLRDRFGLWMEEQAGLQNLSAEAIQAYQFANPPSMSADGLLRYWKKVRMAAP